MFVVFFPTIFISLVLKPPALKPLSRKKKSNLKGLWTTAGILK